jgi:hypothetical protein
MHGNLHKDQLHHQLPRTNHNLWQQVHPHGLVDGTPHKNAIDKAASPSATTNHAPLITPSTAALAANVDAISSTAKYACYIYQIMCSPPASTLLRALDLSEELATIPGLTTALIKNHPPLPTRDTSSDTKPIQLPCIICSPTLLPHVPRLIVCSPLKKSVLCKMSSALPCLPMP